MATPEIYTLSLHDALPILGAQDYSIVSRLNGKPAIVIPVYQLPGITMAGLRSEEHTSELQSLRHLVCRLLLEKKNNIEAADRTAEEIDEEPVILRVRRPAR